MTLDNFFTSTEMNNGLVAPYRVREFMAVMQKETDCVVKNTASSTKQWSAVARAIAATESKDCLDLFIELDGLRFISKLLKDAQKFGDDTIDSFVEESITHLLRALGKMHLDYKKLVESEIWMTVEDFLVHKSSKVQDSARVLFESWKSKRDSDASTSDVDEPIAFVGDKAGKGSDIEGVAGRSDASPEKVLSTSSDIEGVARRSDASLEKVLSTSSDAVHPGQVESADNSNKSLDPPIEDERPLNHVSSPSLPKPVTEPLVCHSIDTTSQPSIQAVSGQDTLETRTELNDLEKLGSLEESKTSEGRHLTSCSDAVDEVKTVMEVNSRENSVIGGKNSSDEGLSVINSRTIDSDGKDASSDANQNRSLSANISNERGDFDNCVMPKSSGHENHWGDSKGLGTFLDGKVNTFGLLPSNNDLSDNYSFGKKSDVETDYGIIDPLEVARQVAMEVEREVVDYREQSCSSSEKPSQRTTHANEGSPKDVSNDQNSSEKSSAMQEESETSSENLEMEQTNGTQDIAISQVIEAAREEGANTEKGMCSFDLNEEVHMEDSDNPGNQISTPVSTVSASRAAAAPGLPGSPLQFEGNLGWKGSATTSAFRRLPESDKMNSRRSENFDFDLNVAGESSVEMNSKGSKNLELDLNHTSNDGGPQGNFRSYSSSSSKQPISNIDLNDQPLIDSSDNPHISKVSQNLEFFGGIKSDESAISIMGTRVEVNRRDLLNGKTPELAFDVDLGRTSNFLGMGPALQYTHSSVYSYNNSMAHPLAMPFSSTIYGSGPPIPYMVGSASAVPTAFSQPPPFLMNMNGVGTSRSSFDLDSGMSADSGSKDTLGLRMFLNSANARNVDEQLRLDSQPNVGPVIGGGKRKEPENGWENYPFRHYTPPWKHN